MKLRKLHKAIFLVTLLALILIVSMAIPVLAEWSGALTITREHPIGHEPLTIYTVALDYAITDWWYVDLIVDTHPAQGVDTDVSTTMYLPQILSKTIYVTAGMRTGVWHSPRPPTPYWSLAFRF